MSKAYDEGYEAFGRVPQSEYPYPLNSKPYFDWINGWEAAQEDHQSDEWLRDFDMMPECRNRGEL